ncbi:MAG TPA: DNA-3-methyladenine glycosylase [Tepidisphaeraceae bacterium]|jgi:DNA-3-methyladenine glycosylase II|nr:DNA-3-methyladenine glycosylase [Tepidisphaeraceae bacterium]
MWLAAKSKVDWTEATDHLSRVDPKLARVMARAGPCTLKPGGDCFIALCRAIISQQISGVVAKAIVKRFKKLFPRSRPTAKHLLTLTDDQLRSAGLSRQKMAYLRDLAAHFADGKVPIRRFSKMTDEEIIQSLIPIKGIGRWTAEMFLIFVLNRPDLLPVDDLGVRKGFQKVYGLRSEPKAAKMIEIAQKWRPWRTIGSWYMWRGM